MPPALKQIATTRFTTDTYGQFNAFGERTGQHWYGSPRMAPETIDMNRGVMVIEMNNSENVIEGLGLIAVGGYGRRQWVYPDEPNWCRHTYRREAWFAPEEAVEKLGVERWSALHTYMFRSVHNQKRWSGITGWKCHDPELLEALLRVRQELIVAMDEKLLTEMAQSTEISSAEEPHPLRCGRDA
jgi:hypothetical protein